MGKKIKIALKSTLPYFFPIVALSGVACLNRGGSPPSPTKGMHNGTVEKPTSTVVDEDNKISEQDQSQDLDASMATETVQPVSMHKAETTSSFIRASQKGQEITSKEATNNVSSLDQTTANSNTSNPRNTVEHNQVTEKTKEKLNGQRQEILGEIDKVLELQELKDLKVLKDKLKELESRKKESKNKKKLYDSIINTIQTLIDLIKQLEQAKNDLQSLTDEDDLTKQKEEVKGIIESIKTEKTTRKIDSQYIQDKIQAIEHKLK